MKRKKNRNENQREFLVGKSNYDESVWWMFVGIFFVISIS